MPGHIKIKEYCPRCKTLRGYYTYKELASTCVGKYEENYTWKYARCEVCNKIIPIPEFEEETKRNLVEAQDKIRNKFLKLKK